MTDYVIRTNLPPQAVSRIGIEIYKLWLDFALGGNAIGGKQLLYPSGKYASAIRYEQTGVASVAITADSGIAPEVDILEHGHGPFDMKTVAALQGRAIPMHRRVAGPTVAAATGLRRVGATTSPGTLRPSMWAEVRASTGTGFASIGPNSAPGSWIIPAMPAYSTALTLSAIAQRMADGLAS